MPATALKIPFKEVTLRIQFITEQHDDNLIINVYECDENFIPKGKPVVTTLQIAEELYHRRLREDANLKEHFQKGFSTNPEWNPDYNEL